METKKQQLKRWREAFRNDCLERDKGKCIFCGDPAIDAHHIIDRSKMPNGGYVIHNGASACGACHVKAELFHDSDGMAWIPGFHPNDIYAKIGSSYEEAVEASERLI